MKEKKRKIAIATLAFFLDTYGYAAVGNANQEISLPAAQLMYKTFLGENDPVVSKTLAEAAIAKKDINEYLLEKKEYESLKDKKGKVAPKLSLNSYCENSLTAVEMSQAMYKQKRQDIIYELTSKQALSYYSENEKPIIDIPKNNINKIKQTNKKLSEILKEDPNSPILTTFSAIDNYKVYGLINAKVWEYIASQRIEAANKGGLEKTVNKETANTKEKNTTQTEYIPQELYKSSTKKTSSIQKNNTKSTQKNQENKTPEQQPNKKQNYQPTKTENISNTKEGQHNPIKTNKKESTKKSISPDTKSHKTNTNTSNPPKNKNSTIKEQKDDKIFTYKISEPTKNEGMNFYEAEEEANKKKIEIEETIEKRKYELSIKKQEIANGEDKLIENKGFDAYGIEILFTEKDRNRMKELPQSINQTHDQ